MFFCKERFIIFFLEQIFSLDMLHPVSFRDYVSYDDTIVYTLHYLSIETSIEGLNKLKLILDQNLSRYL